LRKVYLLSGSGLGDSHGDTEDSVGTEFALVRGTIEVNKELINLFLVGDVEFGLDEFGSDNVVDVGDGLGNT